MMPRGEINRQVVSRFFFIFARWKHGLVDSAFSERFNETEISVKRKRSSFANCSSDDLIKCLIEFGPFR